jgi:hypothetical protein
MTTVKTAEFIRSNTDEDMLLTVRPRIFRRNMVSSYGYTIRGNDDTCIKRKKIEVGDREPIFITFSVIKGATYFIKLDIIYVDESKQKYRLFYSVEDDFNQDSDKEQEFFDVEKEEDGEDDGEQDEIEEIDCDIENLEVD